MTAVTSYLKLIQNRTSGSVTPLVEPAAPHVRELIPPFLLFQPHRKGYPHEFMARGMAEVDAGPVAQGAKMQEEFLQYALDVGYLKPWEDAYFVAYTLAHAGRRWLYERGD